MFKKILAIAAMMIAFPTAVLAQQQFYGDSSSTWLGIDGWCGIDWYKPQVFNASKSTLVNGGQLKLQARFQWQGSGTVPYVAGKTGEHAFIAFTQGSHTNGAQTCPYGGSSSLLNASRHTPQQWLHKSGVGALVSPVGLLIEAWNGDFTAYKWSQEDGRCDVSVPGNIKGNTCLAASSGTSDSYIESNPGFQLIKGEYYWLRLTLTGGGNGNPNYVTAKAELFHQTSSQNIPLQAGQISLLREQFFPTSGVIESTVGRTGFEFGATPYTPSNILFWSFNYGF